jgi:hypothetical protein
VPSSRAFFRSTAALREDTRGFLHPLAPSFFVGRRSAGRSSGRARVEAARALAVSPPQDEAAWTALRKAQLTARAAAMTPPAVRFSEPRRSGCWSNWDRHCVAAEFELRT